MWIQQDAYYNPSRTMAHLLPENLEEIELPHIEEKELCFYENLVEAAAGNAQPFVTHEQIIRLMEVVDKVMEYCYHSTPSNISPSRIFICGKLFNTISCSAL